MELSQACVEFENWMLVLLNFHIILTKLELTTEFYMCSWA